VPPFVKAHTFCTSWYIFREFAQQYNNIFAQFMTMWKKQILAGAVGVQGGRLGVAMHFSEIIELINLDRNCHTFFVF